MITRFAGGLLVLLASFLAFAPALVWFSAETPAGRVTATGYESAGALWLLPVVAAGVALGGAALMAAGPARRARVARWAGPAVVLAGLAALAVAVWAGTGGDVVLTVRGHEVAGPVAVPVDREPAAWAAGVAAIIASGVGLVTAIAAWRP